MNNLGRTAGITSPKDRSGLKARWLHLSENELNTIEMEFIFAAQKKYFARIGSPLRWFTIPFLLRVHREMLGSVWDWAGRFRHTEKNIGVKAYLIQTQLKSLCDDVAHWNSEPVQIQAVEQACLIHYRLALIHPFEDGNGRFSRLIADRYLKAHGCTHPMWPDNLHEDGEPRKVYINSLREADRGDLSSLIAFARKYGASSPSEARLAVKQM